MSSSVPNIFEAIADLKKAKKTKQLAESLQPVLYTLALSIDTGDAAHELWRNIFVEQLRKETADRHGATPHSTHKKK